MLKKKMNFCQQMASELKDKITLNSESSVDSFENETLSKKVRSNKEAITLFTNDENATANQVEKFNNCEKV